MIRQALALLCVLADVAAGTASDRTENPRCWKQFQNYRHNSLTNRLGVYDAVGCMRACRKFFFCTAAGVDDSLNPCWIQSKNGPAILEKDLSRRNNWVTYLYNDTCGDVEDDKALRKNKETRCWIKHEKRDSLGQAFERGHGIFNVQDCIAKCMENEVCTIVEFNVKSGTFCWFQNSAMAKITKHDLVVNNAVTTFLFDPVCYRRSLGKSDYRCWQNRKNKMHKKGVLKLAKGVHDLEACMDACRELEFCRAVDHSDVVGDSRCLYQRDHTLSFCKIDLVESRAFTSYMHNATCEYFFRGKIDTCWTISENKKVNGLRKHPADKITECKKACIMDSRCTIVDWHHEQLSCYVQDNPALSSANAHDSHGVTHHHLDRECMERFDPAEPHSEDDDDDEDS